MQTVTALCIDQHRLTSLRWWEPPPAHPSEARAHHLTFSKGLRQGRGRNTQTHCRLKTYFMLQFSPQPMSTQKERPTYTYTHRNPCSCMMSQMFITGCGPANVQYELWFCCRGSVHTATKTRSSSTGMRPTLQGPKAWGQTPKKLLSLWHSQLCARKRGCWWITLTKSNLPWTGPAGKLQWLKMMNISWYQ